MAQHRLVTTLIAERRRVRGTVSGLDLRGVVDLLAAGTKERPKT